MKTKKLFAVHPADTSAYTNARKSIDIPLQRFAEEGFLRVPYWKDYPGGVGHSQVTRIARKVAAQMGRPYIEATPLLDYRIGSGPDDGHHVHDDKGDFLYRIIGWQITVKKQAKLHPLVAPLFLMAQSGSIETPSGRYTQKYVPRTSGLAVGEPHVVDVQRKTQWIFNVTDYAFAESYFKLWSERDEMRTALGLAPRITQTGN